MFLPLQQPTFYLEICLSMLLCMQNMTFLLTKAVGIECSTISISFVCIPCNWSNEQLLGFLHSFKIEGLVYIYVGVFS